MTWFHRHEVCDGFLLRIGLVAALAVLPKPGFGQVPVRDIRDARGKPQAGPPIVEIIERWPIAPAPSGGGRYLVKLPDGRLIGDLTSRDRPYISSDSLKITLARNAWQLYQNASS